MKATVRDMKYTPSEFCLSQGHKGGEHTHYKNGRKVRPTGFGWATESSPSRLTAVCEIKGKLYDVWVDQAFRERGWERLTKPRVKAIMESCPDKIKVEECESFNGNTYYTAKDESMDAWFRDAKKARK